MSSSCCDCATANPQMYTLGGVTGASNPNGVVTADKSDMTAETTAALASANLSAARAAAGSVANPAVAGYTCGGAGAVNNSATTVSTADKTVFSTDTTAAQSSADLSSARQEVASLSERTTKGYFIGGGKDVAGVLTAVKTADKLTFSGDSTGAVATADLTTAVKFPAGMNGDSTKGYVAGGFTGFVGTEVVTAYKITFSTDGTAAQASANLTVARFGLYAGSDGSTKGYWVGGQNGSPVTTIDKIVVSTDTTSAIAATIGADEGASGSDGTKLVLLGGSTAAVIAQKLTFATDALAAFGSGGAGNLSSNRKACCGFSTSAL